MRGKNPAWVILISDEQQIATANLSGTVIRRYSSEPLVAFVSRCLKTESITQLQKTFDHVIVAPDGPKRGKDFLLVETLTLTLFSALVVVRDGALMFWKFDEACETGAAFLQSNTQEKNWMLVAVAPNLERYSAAVRMLQEGRSFDSQFIMDSIAFVTKQCLPETTGVLWSKLNHYDGLKMPLVQVDSKMLEEGINIRDGMAGFWKKLIYPTLASSLNPEEKIRRSIGRPKNDTNSGIAIVGMSCRFPGANSVEEYWQVLTSGLSTANGPPSSRLGKCQLTEDMRLNFLKCPIDEFDASFFGIAPSQLAPVDPQARLLLEVSWEAFEDAGINPEKLRTAPIGVFYGSWAQEYKDLLNSNQKPYEDSHKKYMGNGFACTAAKLSFFYGFTGPNRATEAGCSSSLVAVQSACESLQNGECPLALAAGANIVLHLDQQLKVLLATDGICRSFDSQANGYGRAEGVGVLLLKRYSDAIRDGDRIHGLILGSASSQEGLSSSFGTPTVDIEEKTMRDALHSAKVQPADVDYVEAHATGTIVGDPIEAEAIVKAYSSSTPRETPLLVGSVKTNIGHAESCSGIASVIKVLLAMKHETIPAHINVKTVNPKVNFSPIPGKLALQNEPWKRSTERPRIAGVSNFGISGTDVHIILQEPPEQLIGQSLRTVGQLPLHILTFSAKSSAALDQLAESYQKLLEQGSDPLIDLIYTANTAKAHLRPFRRALVASSKEEFIQQLKEQNPGQINQIEWKGINVAFICHDVLNQNDFEQYRGLYFMFPAFQIGMDVCDAVCKSTTGFSPLAYLLNKSSPASTWDRKHWQACVLSTTRSLYKLWESWGVKANTVFGLNFGELVGAAITGELELAQCFRFIMNLGVDQKKENIKKSCIHFISAKKGREERLSLEHWKEICCQKTDGEAELASFLLNNQSKFGRDIVLRLDLQTKLEFGLEGTKVSSGNGLPCLLSSLATLYTSGYPVDWEGFYSYQACNKLALPHYPFQRKPIWFKRENIGKKSAAEKTTLQQWNSNVHPLLGSYVPSDSSEDEVSAEHKFENLLRVEQQAPYLAAHLISSELIFPGAAHLELLLAAASFQGDVEMPMVVEKFEIHQPLHLPSNSGNLLRTSLSQTETRWNIMVESQTESSWRRCASGEVKSGQLELQPELCFDELKDRLVVAAKSSSSAFYETIGKLGLNFRSEFKSLGNIRESESGDEVVAEVSIPRDAAHYACHPLLADAMLQCFMYSKYTALTTLSVPVGIKKFVCYRRLRPSDCCGSFANIYFNERQQTVFLLDSRGALVASMTAPEFKATTINSVLAAAGCPPKKTRDGDLDIFEVFWKPATIYQSEGSLTPALDFTKAPSYITLLRTLERHNVLLSGEEQLFTQVERLSELFVYKAFYELGWTPKLGETVLVSELATEFHIASNFGAAFRYFFSYFEKSGVVEIAGQLKNTKLKVLRLPEKRELVENSIAHLLHLFEESEFVQSLAACASLLAPVLQGKRQGQQILFEPGEGGVAHADILYDADSFYKSSAHAAPKVFHEIAAQLWHNELATGNRSRQRLRVLEVGGGTAVFTSQAITFLEGEGIEYSYHFTDISSHFFKKARSRFPQLIYKTLDLERDPLEQGFPPAYFDIVVGMDVLHATKNLRKSVAHLKMLMKTGGQLLLGEFNKPIKETDVTFGILDGYWHFEDHELRPTHCTLSAEQWQELLSKNGFRGPSSSVLLWNNHLCVVVATLSHPELVDRSPELMKTWLLLHDMNESGNWLEGISKRMSNLGRKVISYEIQSSGDIESCISDETNLEGILCFFRDGDATSASNNCRNLLEPMLQASKFLIKNKSWASVPRLYVATSGLWMECESESNPSSATVWGFLRSARMELPWLTTKLVDVDPDIELELRMESLLQEIWMGDGETEAVYRGGVRYTRRLNLVNPQTQHQIVAIPNNCKDYSVLLPTSKLLQDVIYVPKTMAEPVVYQVIVEVRATSLNFKDVLHVMKPTDDFKEMNNIGIDFAGVVSAVGTGVTKLRIGTPVFGVSMGQSTISGYISSSTELVGVIPPNLTFAEAATLPVAFITGWHCLVDVAHASSGQTILIHAASGGVGLMAIQIAKYLGLNIVATAGSQKKRKYLRALGITHVFNSRTLEFSQQIKRITNGVDIVLNCLTGPGFKEASLEICKDGGCFVEMSKLDVWEEHEVKARKPGVNYNIVDLSAAEPTCTGRLLDSLLKMMDEGFLKPLPYTRFTASRIVSALQFLQKAKQIGKVVVEMPHFDLKEERFKEQLFNEQSTYLITGGNGAIGLAIAEWMVDKGAKHLVLLGRSLPNEKALELIQKLEQEAGAKILSIEGDVADFHQMKSILENIQKDPNFPPLRGIHHCAGVLSDNMVANQTWDSFEYSLNPKVKGSYNLHLLTLQSPLEFFVVHSSMVCMIGNPGQTNHSSGCLYTEALMESRVANGLPGMSISWGQWDAGLAENLEIESLYAFTIAQGIVTLEKLVLENRAAGGAGFITTSKLCAHFPAYEQTFLETIPRQHGLENGRQTDENEETLSEVYRKAGGDEMLQLDMISKVVKKKLCETLGINTHEVGERVQFSTMGLDSLMNIEFYNKLQSAMGKIELGYIDMEQHGTVEQLVTIIKTAMDKALV